MQYVTSEAFYVTGGTLPLDSPSYVTRLADHDLFAALEEGQYCYVLNSRQMGKSSLMTRCAKKLRSAGIRVHILDLQKYGSNLTAEQWYRGILEDLIVGLALPDGARDYWRENREVGPLNRFLNIVRDFLLPALTTAQAPHEGSDSTRENGAANAITSRTPSLVIFIDEVDYILSLPFSADELFAGIRDCYNRRSEDPRYGLLTFCLLGVATPADLIRDPQTTPFNIGRRIVLRDFTSEEAAPLAAGLFSRGPDAIDAPLVTPNRKPKTENRKSLDRILYWTHGHPYLTQKLCRAAAEAIRSSAQNEGCTSPGHPRTVLPSLIDRLVADLFLSARAEEQEDNLLFVRNRLLKGSTDLAAVLDTYKTVWKGRQVLDDDANPHVALLKLSGIVRVDKGTLRVRNQIYRSVFNLQWIERSMPDAEMRRQRSARRKGFFHAAAIALPIILLLSFLTVASLSLLHRANKAENDLTGQNAQLAHERNFANEAKGRAERSAEAARREKRKSDRSAEIAHRAKLEADINAATAKRAKHDADKNAATATLSNQKALASKGIAERQKKLADQALMTEKAILYPHRIERAGKALNQGYPEEASTILDTAIGNWRGPEWYYLRSLAEPACKTRVSVYRETPGKKQDKRVKLVSCSPDGHTVATYCDNECSALWQILPSQKLADLNGMPDVYAMTFFEGGRKLACGTDKGIVVCDAASGRKIAGWDKLAPSRNTVQDQVLSLAVAPDGRTMAYGMDIRDVGLRDLTAPNREPRWLRFPGDTVQPNPRHFSVTCVAFSSDGSLVAAGMGKSDAKSTKRICVWNVRSRMAIAQCSVPQSEIEGDLYVNALVFSADGKHLLAGSGSGHIYVWDIIGAAPESRSPLRAIAAHPGGVHSLLLTSDGATLASCGDDGAIKLWDVSRLGEGIAPLLIDTYRGHSGPVLCLAFTPDEHTLVSGGSDGTMRYWNRDPRQNTVWDRETQMFLLASTQDGRRYLACGDDGYVSVRDTKTARMLFHFQQSGTVYVRAALSPDGRMVAVSYLLADKTCSLALYSVDSGRKLGEFVKNVEGFECLVFSPDGRYLATGARDPAAGNWPFRVRLWDVAARKEICAFTGLAGTVNGHGGWVECLAFSNDGKTLVSGGGENNLRFWDVASHKESMPQITEAHHGYLRCAAFSPNGKWLATGGSDGVAKLWRWKNGRIVDREHPIILRGHRATVKTVAFDKDGKTLVTTGEEGMIKFWSMTTVESDYVQEALALPVEPYGDYPVAGAFFAPAASPGTGSGQIIVGLQSGQILYWGKGSQASHGVRPVSTQSLAQKVMPSYHGRDGRNQAREALKVGGR